MLRRKGLKAYNIIIMIIVELACYECFEYDSWGRTLNMTYPDGEVVNYGYDHGGQLITVRGNKGGSIYDYLNDVKYNEFGAKTEQLYGNQLTTGWQYNPYNQRLQSQQIQDNSGHYYMLTEYQYDNAGNITQMYNDHFAGNQLFTSHQFEYDAANQLVHAQEVNNQTYNMYVNYGYYGRVNDYILSSQDPVSNVNQSKNSNYQYVNQANSFAADYSVEYIYNNGNQYNTQAEYSYGINGSLRHRKIANDGTGYPREEYYLFDAHGNMNAYCDNREKYAYYGYDDAGQRTYKMTFDNTTAGNNTQYYPHLVPDKIAFYPNGFLNVNQYGEYTKHYYAESQRIASKLGSGSILSDNLCNDVENYHIESPHLINELQDLAWEKAHQYLTFVPIPEAWVEIADIGNLCVLQGDASSYEYDLFFYHGNHLSSTQMITDMSQNVIQQVHYAPFGEVVAEYNAQWHSGLLPDYMFNGKELDPETGMYYYEARYYNPVMSTFNSRDPMFEKYFWMSPYAYCANNPVKYIDPTGKDVEVTENENGTYTVTGGTLNKDKSIYIMKDGQRTGDVLGQTLTEHSFFGDDGKVVTGAVINPNDNSGQEFLDNLKSDNPGFYSYALDARNNQKYDFKSEGGNNPLNHYRGMPIKDNNNVVYASARDIGNYGAGYVAARNGKSWDDTRYAFDTYQTYKSGGFSEGKRYSEGMPSQTAQRVGFNAGTRQRQQDKRIQMEIWGTPNRMPNGQSIPRR